MLETIMPYKCRCGGTLKKSQCPVEFFHIDFGIQECEVCTNCNAEYLEEKILAKIEEEVKKKKLFGLEKNITITKSGNSLVIRIPPEIAKFTNIKYKTMAKMFPVDAKRIEIELSG